MPCQNTLQIGKLFTVYAKKTTGKCLVLGRKSAVCTSSLFLISGEKAACNSSDIYLFGIRMVPGLKIFSLFLGPESQGPISPPQESHSTVRKGGESMCRVHTAILRLKIHLLILDQRPN